MEEDKQYDYSLGLSQQGFTATDPDYGSNHSDNIEAEQDMLNDMEQDS